MKNNSKKKKIVLFCLLGLVLCLVAIYLGLNKEQTLKTSDQYANYQQKGMVKHDGIVLVDSTNISGTSDSAITSGGASKINNADNYFEEIRDTITSDRNQVISMLDEVISETENEIERENATQQRLKIIDYMEKEKAVENMISEKELPESLVLLTDNAVNVTVNQETLNQSDVKKISEIVIRETGRPANQIIIQSKV